MDTCEIEGGEKGQDVDDMIEELEPFSE